MVSPNANTVPEVLGGLYILLSYGLFFWRTFKKNPGNRVIEFGSITVMMFFALAVLNKYSSLPDWLIYPSLLLIFLLCLCTLFFLGLRGYRALRRRKTE